MNYEKILIWWSFWTPIIRIEKITIINYYLYYIFDCYQFLYQNFWCFYKDFLLLFLINFISLNLCLCKALSHSQIINPMDKKKDLKRKNQSSLTIKAVADHTVKIILDSALELTNWIPALLSPSFLSLTTPIFSFEIVSEQLPIKGFTNSQINETIKILFSNPFPNKLKICFDSCCDLIKIEKFRLFCEKHLWEHLDSYEDGVITIGDLYEFIANFNIWKLLYKVFKATDPYICVVFSRSKRTFKISKIEYVN